MSRRFLSWWDDAGLLHPPHPRRLAVLGATGSIGRNVRDIVQRFPDRFQVVALAARANVDQILGWLDRVQPEYIALVNAQAAKDLRERISGHPQWCRIRILTGPESLEAVATLPEVDTVVSAIVGAAGLAPTYAALRQGKRVCLANKESLVIGGALIRRVAEQNGGTLIPIDSEHVALFQVMVGERRSSIQRLWLTASGGPFLHRPLESFDQVTPEETLQHPNWKMGPKITVDSATLMNKGLELIEAHYLFDWPADRIEVVIHPQSIVHSLVEFVDGSFKAQLSRPDMRLPILYALAYPERLPLEIEAWEPWESGRLEFFRPDEKRFPCLRLAREALQAGPSHPVVLNAANEVAVEAFLERAIPFTEIPKLIERALASHGGSSIQNLEDLWALDTRTRAQVRGWIKNGR